MDTGVTEAAKPSAVLPVPLSLQDWSANPLFERKDNKKEALLDLEGRLPNLNKRYTAVKDAGLKIQAMVAVRDLPGARGQGGGTGAAAPSRRPRCSPDCALTARALLPSGARSRRSEGVSAPAPARDGDGQGTASCKAYEACPPGTGCVGTSTVWPAVPRAPPTHGRVLCHGWSRGLGCGPVLPASGPSARGPALPGALPGSPTAWGSGASLPRPPWTVVCFRGALWRWGSALPWKGENSPWSSG